MKSPIRIIVTSLAFLLLQQYSAQGEKRVDWDGLKQLAANGKLFTRLDSYAERVNSTASSVYDLQSVKALVNHPNSPWIVVTANTLAGQQSTDETQNELDKLVWGFLTQIVLNQEAAEQAKNSDGTRKSVVLQFRIEANIPVSPTPPTPRREVDATVLVDDAVLREMLGEAMHSYFRRDFDDAIKILTTVIEYRFQDPRAFYFRGLAFEQMGRTYEAEADWKVGADLEADGRVPNGVNESLYRVQGSLRMRIETLRLKARLLAGNR